jgi:hypothetical protein
MNKSRERTLARWEGHLPEFINRSTEDLKFLLLIESLDNTIPGFMKSKNLLRQAWEPEQEKFHKEFDLQFLIDSIEEARQFLKDPAFQEYKARFERYL